MKFKFICLLLCFIHVVHGQKTSVKKFQNFIAKHQFTNQDSCKFYLDKLYQHKDRLQDTTYSKLLNDYGIYYGIQNELDSALFYFNKSVSILKDKNNKYKALGLKNIANVYKLKGEYDKALKILFKSLSIARTQKDLNIESNILGDISSNYFYKQRYDLAIKYCYQSTNTLKVLKNQKLLAIQQIRLGNILLEVGKNYEAKQEFVAASNYFKTDKDEKINFYRSILNLGDCYFEESNYKKALDYYKKAFNGLKKNKDKEVEAIAMSKIAICNTKLDNFKIEKLDLSRSYQYLKTIKSSYTLEIGIELLNIHLVDKKWIDAKKLSDELIAIRKQTDPLSTQINLLNCLETIYEKYNDTQNLIKTLKEIKKLNAIYSENFYRLKSLEIIEKYDKKIIEDKNIKLELENKNLKLQIWLYILISTIILLIFIVQIKKRRREINNEKERNKYLVNEKIILEEKAKFEKKNTDLKEELINIKEREIVACNLESIQLKNNIRDIISEAEKNQNFKLLKKNINSLISNDNFMNEFKDKFLKIHPDFSKKILLTYPSLTNKEIEFLILVKLKLNNKEIANFLAINYETVVSKKYLLRKKMNISSDLQMITILDGI